MEERWCGPAVSFIVDSEQSRSVLHGVLTVKWRIVLELGTECYRELPQPGAVLDDKLFGVCVYLPTTFVGLGLRFG